MSDMSPDVELLAYLLHDSGCTSPCDPMVYAHCFSAARAVLASDWLAARDARVANDAFVAALREAAEDWGAGDGLDQWLADGVEDDVSAVQSAVMWLRDRADEEAK